MWGYVGVFCAILYQVKLVHFKSTLNMGVVKQCRTYQNIMYLFLVLPLLKTVRQKKQGVEYNLKCDEFVS